MVEFAGQKGELFTVWVICAYPTIALGLAEILKARTSVHIGSETPKDKDSLSSVVYCANGDEDPADEIKCLRSLVPDVPIVVFGIRGDLSLARIALQSGARGFIHAGMQPSQIARAVLVASNGEVAVPRELLEELIAGKAPVDTTILSPRQQEVLELVCEGLTNSQIAKRLYLSEFTIKQHLRAAYKLLGVRNRTEAARLLRGSA